MFYKVHMLKRIQTNIIYVAVVLFISNLLLVEVLLKNNYWNESKKKIEKLKETKNRLT